MSWNMFSVETGSWFRFTGRWSRQCACLRNTPQIRVESVGEKEIHISHAMKEEEIAQLIAQMIQNGIIVTGFYKEEGNLESLFMQLTGGQEDEN